MSGRWWCPDGWSAMPNVPTRAREMHLHNGTYYLHANDCPHCWREASDIQSDAIKRLRQENTALRALVKEAFCEGMMSAEGAPRPLNSDLESAWRYSESRELLESF